MCEAWLNSSAFESAPPLLRSANSARITVCCTGAVAAGPRATGAAPAALADGPALLESLPPSSRSPPPAPGASPGAAAAAGGVAENVGARRAVCVPLRKRKYLCGVARDAEPHLHALAFQSRKGDGRVSTIARHCVAAATQSDTGQGQRVAHRSGQGVRVAQGRTDQEADAPRRR
jgi:hypothetical protein